MPTAFDADTYAASLSEDRGFETRCEQARHNFNLRHLARLAPRRILEIGCGEDLLFDRAASGGVAFDRWTIVEPASAFAAACRRRASGDARLQVIECMCEELAASPEGRALADFDLVLVSGVLHHAVDPGALLRAALTPVRSGGHVLANTPNALSFHRLLAVEMGLAATPYDRDERTARLQKTSVFDPESLRELLESCGVGELEFEGYMFKPFTHDQMETVLALLPPDAVAGLEALGRKFPRNAAEIGYVGVKR